MHIFILINNEKIILKIVNNKDKFDIGNII